MIYIHVWLTVLSHLHMSPHTELAWYIHSSWISPAFNDMSTKPAVMVQTDRFKHQSVFSIVNSKIQRWWFQNCLESSLTHNLVTSSVSRQVLLDFLRASTACAVHWHWRSQTSMLSGGALARHRVEARRKVTRAQSITTIRRLDRPKY